MLSSFYVHAATGVSPERLSRCHSSTRQRTTAFAIALPIPVAAWAVSGGIVAGRLFAMDTPRALAVAGTCAGLVFCVERLIMSSPKRWYVSACRLAIALTTATICACASDLCLFAPEIEGQIRADAQHELVATYDARIARQSTLVEQHKRDWDAAEAKKNCEADGTCGSGLRQPGTIWRALDAEARLRREDYREAVGAEDKLLADKDAAVAALATSPAVMREAGILARLDALQAFTASHPAAHKAWLLLFALMVALETLVLLVKVAFGVTVDDRLEQLRERVSDHQAQAWCDAMTTREGHARALINRASLVGARPSTSHVAAATDRFIPLS